MSAVQGFLLGLSLTMVNRFGLSMGCLRWVDMALVVLAVITLVWSFHMEGAIHFEHRRPPPP